MPLFNALSPETRRILDSVPALINKIFPIPGKFRSELPSNIAELSRLLTNRRGDRSLSYQGRPGFLSAYLHYFLPWNLYRLCLLLSRLDITLSPGDTITDIGCGPLTLTSALWIARPDLRKTPLEFFCLDRNSPVLAAGKKFFASLGEEAGSWKIHTVREDINLRQAGVTRKTRSASLVCAVNLFNEIYETLPHNNTAGLRRMAANAAQLLNSLSKDDACLLTVEPGVPLSGQFISFLRTSFLEMGRPPSSPCPHTAACPFPGGKKRWCHFAFETFEAPKELMRLSASAGLPKERLVFSFLLAGPVSKQPAPSAKTEKKMRVISDAFPLPDNRYGRYCCSSSGLVLLAGDKRRVERTVPLSLVTPVFTADRQRDKKSGALISGVK